MKDMKLNAEEKFILADYFSFDIAPYTSICVFEPEEDIFKEGDRPKCLFYLLSGRAKLYLSHDNGKISLINFLDAPCFIGEMELLDNHKLTDGVKAMTTCKCYVIDIEKCKKQILNDTKFLQYLCRFLSKKAITNTSHYTQNQSYDLKNRLASFILKTTLNGWYRERHTEVAEYLGVSYRHLLYIIADFVQNGILEKNKNGYKVVDVEKLRKLSHD